MTAVSILSWIGAVVALCSAGWLFFDYRYKRHFWVIDVAGLICLATYGIVGIVVDHNANALLTALYFTLVLEVAFIFQQARVDANEETLLQIFDENPKFEQAFRRRYKKFERFGIRLPTRESRESDTDRQ